MDREENSRVICCNWIGSMGSTIQHSKNGVTKISLYSGLRGTVRALFVIMRAGSVRNNLAAAMLNQLACSKMNHIRMVHEFIMTRYLEVSASSYKARQAQAIGNPLYRCFNNFNTKNIYQGQLGLLSKERYLSI